MLALRAALGHLRSLAPEARRSITAAELRAAIGHASPSPEASRRAVDAVDRVLNLRTEGSSAPPWLAVTGALMIVATVITTLIVWRGGTDSTVPETAASTIPTTPAAATTTPTAVGPTATTSRESDDEGFFVEFAPTVAGEFEIERYWRVTPGSQELIGVSVLTPAGETGVVEIFNEIVPPAIPRGTEIAWTLNGVTIEPAQFTHPWARFTQLALEPGEVHVIEYRAVIPDGTRVTRALLQEWFDEWLPLVNEANVVLDAFLDADYRPSFEVGDRPAFDASPTGG